VVSGQQVQQEHQDLRVFQGLVMHKKSLALSQLYKISFLMFYIIPLITIIFKVIYGEYVQTLFEIWFLILLLFLTAIVFLAPRLDKTNKIKIIYLLVSIVVLFFGLGAIGFEAKYIIIDFEDLTIVTKIPYILMFSILIIQLITLSILRYKSNDNYVVPSINININETLYIMMGIMVILGYLLSILTKVILVIETQYIIHELSILSSYILLYLGLFLLIKFNFKLSTKNSLIQSLFFIPILSIGFALGILLFDESFVFFKLSTFIIGIINMLLFLINQYVIKNDIK
jgi:hypothetical protein